MEAKTEGLAGVVIDGAARNVAGIRELGFPVFARWTVPSAGGAEHLGQINLVVQCGGLPVKLGDVIVGDEDGVVVVPSANAVRVLATARQIVQADAETNEAIRAGQSLWHLLGMEEIATKKQWKSGGK